VQERVRQQLTKNVAALKRLIKLSPFAAGTSFTIADCSAFAALPTVGMASKAVFGTDLLADGGIDWKPYMKMLGERPSVQRVVADRKAAQEAMAGKK
jgi:glutathione S-transferase